MKPTRAPSLEERIEELRIEIEGLVEARALEVAKASPGVPLGVIRKLLTASAPACPCAQYLAISGDVSR